MKKKFLLGLFALPLALSLASCGNNDKQDDNNNENNQKPDNSGTDLIEYKIRVNYPDGTALQSFTGQICDLETCKLPSNTTNGVAVLPNPAADRYFAHILESTLPENYTYNANLYEMSATVTESTITLIKVNQATGSGSKESPYVIGEGCYKLVQEKKADRLYYKINVPAGDYEIESIAQRYAATNPVDPIMKWNTSDTFTGGTTKDDGGFGYNFKQEFTSTGEDLYFYSFCYENPKVTTYFDLEPEFYFTITKKN